MSKNVIGLGKRLASSVVRSDMLEVLIVGAAGKMGSGFTLAFSKEDGVKISAITPHIPSDKDKVTDVTYYDSVDKLENGEESDLVVFLVKPQIIKDVAPKYRGKGVCYLSGLAGTSLKTLEDLVSVDGEPVAVARVMPNIALTIGEAMNGIVFNENVSEEQKRNIMRLLAPTGKMVVLDSEDMLNRFTAVAGSGPAYILELMRIMVESLKRLSFDENYARTKITSDVIDISTFALSDGRSLKELRDTAIYYQGLQTSGMDGAISLDELRVTFVNTVGAAYRRSLELAAISKGERSASEESRALDASRPADGSSPISYKDDPLYTLVEKCGNSAALLEVAIMFVEATEGLGFSSEESRLMVLQTMRGSAKLAQAKPEKSLGEIRDSVVSPKGTTYYGLQELTKGVIEKFCEVVLTAALKSHTTATFALGSAARNVGTHPSKVRIEEVTEVEMEK